LAYWYGYSIFIVAADGGLNLSQKEDDPFYLPVEQILKSK